MNCADFRDYVTIQEIGKEVLAHLKSCNKCSRWLDAQSERAAVRSIMKSLGDVWIKTLLDAKATDLKSKN